MAAMSERDISQLRGDYNRARREAEELKHRLKVAVEIAKDYKKSVDSLSAENSKLKRKLARQLNRR